MYYSYIHAEQKQKQEKERELKCRRFVYTISNNSNNNYKTGTDMYVQCIAFIPTRLYRAAKWKREIETRFMEFLDGVYVFVYACMQVHVYIVNGSIKWHTELGNSEKKKKKTIENERKKWISVLKSIFLCALNTNLPTYNHFV